MYVGAYDATIYQPRTASNHASFDGKRSLTMYPATECVD